MSATSYSHSFFTPTNFHMAPQIAHQGCICGVQIVPHKSAIPSLANLHTTLENVGSVTINLNNDELA